MANLNKSTRPSFTISEAVEMLSKIAELDVQYLSGSNWQPLSLEKKMTSISQSKWLQGKNPDFLIQQVKAMFGVILHFLRHFNDSTQPSLNHEKYTAEGVKLIMVLVAEAAKKLDEYQKTKLNQPIKSVKELPEYKRLQNFYENRMAKKIEKEGQHPWVVKLSQQALEQKQREFSLLSQIPSLSTRHVFVDFDVIRKDEDYDLFFIRKEDGARFFSPKLVKNIKLICNFEKIGVDKNLKDFKDPLEEIAFWQDRCFQKAAFQILEAVNDKVDEWFHCCSNYKSYEAVLSMNKALIALFLAKDRKFLKPHWASKTCSEYFSDFYSFLEEALKSKEYQKWIAYPPKKEGGVAHLFLDLIHMITFSLFGVLENYLTLHPLIQEMLGKEESQLSKTKKQELFASHRIESDFLKLTSLLNNHPNGPLNKLLDVLKRGTYQFFDPLAQKNLPGLFYAFRRGEKKVAQLRLPTPTFQEYIHEVVVKEEFRSFLRTLINKDKKMVMFNLQDRTSWREHFRSIALQDLGELLEFSSHFLVVNIPHDTEFYFQQPPYQDTHQTALFFQQIKDTVLDESSGFYFPKSMKHRLKSGCLEELIKGVYTIFFEEKNVLTKENRRDFLEILHLFIYLFVLEAFQPDYMSFVCKDGVDISASENGLFLLFLKQLQGKGMEEKDFEQFNAIFYSASLVLRERLPLLERFQRMMSAFKTIERAVHRWGQDTFLEKMKLIFKEMRFEVLSSRI